MQHLDYASEACILGHIMCSMLGMLGVYESVSSPSDAETR